MNNMTIYENLNVTSQVKTSIVCSSCTFDFGHAMNYKICQDSGKKQKFQIHTTDDVNLFQYLQDIKYIKLLCLL